jgi:hypothetical protein
MPRVRADPDDMGSLLGYRVIIPVVLGCSVVAGAVLLLAVG